MTKLSEVLEDLKSWFPPDAHKERALPGSAGIWFYIPWTLYLQKLNQVCPDEWEVVFSDPSYIDSQTGKLCHVTCTLIICGISRQGIGAVPAEIISSSGKNAERGNAIERAVAESLKNAAEMFGIGAYLDEQTDPKTKADFVKYMQGSGDGRAADFHHRNEGNLPQRTPRPKQANPFGKERAKPALEAVPAIAAKSKLETVPPAAAPSQTRTGSSPYPRLDQIKAKTSISYPWMQSKGISLGFPQSFMAWSDEQIEKMRDECYIQWALMMGEAAWKDEAECRHLFVITITDLGVSKTSDEELWQEWFKQVVDRTKQAEQQA